MFLYDAEQEIGTVICDICDWKRKADGSIIEVVDELREVGWKAERDETHSGWNHVCPDCQIVKQPKRAS